MHKRPLAKLLCAVAVAIGLSASLTTLTAAPLKVGYVASFPIPEVIRDINAIQLILNKYNPGTEIKVVWINSWFDPGKEADATNALIDQGVDLVFKHTDNPAPIQAAERRGLYAVGYASDMAHFGPKAAM